MYLGLKTFTHIDFSIPEIPVEEGPTRYYIAGEHRLPSMTSILNVLDDGGIDEWKALVGEEQAKKIVDEAVKRGNSLHDLSEKYVLNQLERKDIRGPGKILFNRNKPMLDKLDPIVAVEAPLYSIKLKYAGRVDLIAFKDKKLYIIDHKNSRSDINMKKDYCQKKIFKYMLQATGYARAFNEMYPNLPCPKHGMLIIGQHKSHTSKIIDFEIGKFLYKEFDILLDIYYNDICKTNSHFFKIGT